MKYGNLHMVRSVLWNALHAVIIGNSWKLRDRRKQAKAHLNIHKMVYHV